MLLALQLVIVAVVPLNLTVLLPCVDPKFDPAMVTEAPTAPDVGERLEIVGAATAWLPPKETRESESKTITFHVFIHIGTPSCRSSANTEEA